MNVLITGCEGMLGKDMISALRGSYTLAGLDMQKRSSCEFEYFQCDITCQEAVLKSFRLARPDIVLHAAAYTDVDGCEQNPERAYAVNFEGAKNVAAACLAVNAYMIFISTDYVFDGKKGSAYLESVTGNPLSVYGKSKWEAEQYIRQTLARYTIVRTSWLYGTHGKNFVDTILKASKTKSSLQVVADQTGRPTYTVDLAEGLRKLIELFGEKDEKQISGTIHITNEGEASWFDFAKEIVTMAGRQIGVQPITSKELNRPAKRPEYSVLSTERFRELAGTGLRDWKCALADYLRKQL